MRNPLLSNAVMTSRRPPFPDISGILARKARGRGRLAALGFGEKLDRPDALRAQVAPIIRARERRRRGASGIGRKVSG
jgi:hypothetical protein